MGEVTLHYSNRGRNPHYFDERYEIFSTIGRGRASVVYLAGKFSRDETIDIDSPSVALKVLLNTEKNPEGTIRRIKRESLALLSCNHPSIIRMHDYVAREDACYISMEYARYGDLKKLFASEKSFLSPLATLRLMQNVLDGVGVIHSAGIIHRDLKPENLLLNGDYQVKICDFSVCLLKGEQPNLKLVSDVVGTIDYLAPECLRGGEYSTISDLYSVAITCFELLTGTLPFSSQSINQSLERKVSGSIELLPKEISKEFPNLQDFFQKALSPKTENRFQTHLEMKNAIDDVIGNIYEHSKSEGIGSNKKNIRLERFRSFKVLIGEALNLKNVFSLKNFVRFDKKVGAKFFLLSFLVTIASFSLLNLIGDPISVSSDLEGLDPLANREQGSIENSVTNGQIHQSLLSYPGIGILRGLYTENKDYRFVVTPVGKEKIIFGLLVKGWQPVEIDLSLLKNEKPIHIVGKGVDVLMQVDSFGPNDTIEGTFENIVTARTGKWSLSFVKD